MFQLGPATTCPCLVVSLLPQFNRPGDALPGPATTLVLTVAGEAVGLVLDEETSVLEEPLELAVSAGLAPVGRETAAESFRFVLGRP